MTIRKDLKQKVANNIRRLRLQRNMTQEETAEKSGFHYKYYQKVESGTVNLTIDSIEQLALALKVKPRTLFP